MNYLSVEQIAEKWQVSTRSVRNYCVAGRVPGAVLKSGRWFIPSDAKLPGRKARSRPLPKTFDDILDFHVRFETIHPFQDGNGRVGRLLLFKECLKANILPFIIDESLKRFYYRGLHEWSSIREYLRDTCRTGQDRFAEILSKYGHGTSFAYGD